MKKTGKILLIIGGAFLFIAIIFGCIYFVTAENKSVSIIGGAENIVLTRKVMAIMLFQNPLIIFGSLLVTLGTPTLIAGIILLILDKKKEKELEKARAEAAAAKLAGRKAADADTTDENPENA